MPIENFNPKEFSANLTEQAKQLVPADLTDPQKEYMVNKIYQFCVIAANALYDETETPFTESQAVFITQLIGEWTFHKSIDLIRSGVPEDCWDQVLQQVAYVVFEAAKYSQINNKSQAETINLIENEVLSSYQKAISDVAKSGKIKEENISKILSYSNLDTMAKDSLPPALPDDYEGKILKFASIALLLRNMSNEKSKLILDNLDKKEAEYIRSYMQLPDLESQLDQNLAHQFLNDFKRNLSIKSEFSSSPIKKLTENYTTDEIKDIIKFERDKIKNYVAYQVTKKISKNIFVELSPQVSKIIFRYLKTKLSTL